MNDSQASAMNAVAREPASAAAPTSRGARNRKSLAQRDDRQAGDDRRQRHGPPAGATGGTTR